MSLYPYPVIFPPQGETPPASSVLWLSGRRPNPYFSDTARTTPATDGSTVASWHDATNNRSAVQSMAGQRPIRRTAAVEFDGLDDVLAVASASVLRAGNGFAVEAVFRPATTGVGVIAGCDISGARDWLLFRSSASQLGWLVGNAAGTLSDTYPSASTPINTWYHIVGTHVGGRSRLYFNGTLVGTASTIITGPYLTTAQDAWIGARAFGGSNLYFNGQIDELIVYQFGASPPSDAHWAARSAAALALR